MASSNTYRVCRTVGCFGGLVAILVLGCAFAMAWASSGSLVFASYPGTYEFTGFQGMWRTDYYSLKWVPDPGDVGPCPVVVHTDIGDVGAAEFADPKRLLERGWVEVPFLRVAPEVMAAFGPEMDRGLPKVVKYGRGELRVATQHTEGVLTSVWVCVVDSPEERIAQGRPPEHEHELMASRVGPVRYAVSVGGRRITLPISKAELTEALGPPVSQRKDY